MDKLVLAEGLNDIWFLSLLHNTYSDHDRYDYFDNETEEITENKRISQHAIDDNYQYLYKSEGGRPNLSIIFSDIAQSLVGMDMDTYIMADLDGKTTSHLFDEINRFLHQDYGNKSKLIEEKRTNNKDMYIIETTLQNDTRQNLPVTIFAFYSNLEDVTGIIRGESRETKMKKIVAYIRNNESVCEDIATELF